MGKIRWTNVERLSVARKLATLKHDGNGKQKLDALLTAQTVLPTSRQRPFVLSNAPGTIVDLLSMLGEEPAPQPTPPVQPKPANGPSGLDALKSITTILGGGLFSNKNIIGIVGTASLLGLAYCAFKSVAKEDLAKIINSCADTLEKSNAGHSS